MRIALIAMLLSGCATWTQTTQCSVGITFFGPVPVPTVGCELIFEPDDDDEDEDDEEEDED